MSRGVQVSVCCTPQPSGDDWRGGKGGRHGEGRFDVIDMRGDGVTQIKGMGGVHARGCHGDGGVLQAQQTGICTASMSSVPMQPSIVKGSLSQH